MEVVINWRDAGTSAIPLISAGRMFWNVVSVVSLSLLRNIRVMVYLPVGGMCNRNEVTKVFLIYKKKIHLNVFLKIIGKQIDN